jgi:nucleoside 2-deoxyribosyltransferase
MSETPRRRRIYLAGPEVFLPRAPSVGAEKCRLAAAAGFEGVFPYDPHLRHTPLAKCELMRSCDALIANLTPFRGVSADAGTVFELGFMCALGRPVSAYTNASAHYHARATAFRARRPLADDCDRPDCEVEDHDLCDNLMIEMAVVASGGTLIRQQSAAVPDMADLTPFGQCLDVIRRLFNS